MFPDDLTCECIVSIIFSSHPPLQILTVLKQGGEASCMGRYFSKAEKQDRLSVAMDEINRRFGRGSLFHLAEGIKRPWTMKREMLTPSYTTDWNQLPEVK